MRRPSAIDCVHSMWRALPFGHVYPTQWVHSARVTSTDFHPISGHRFPADVRTSNGTDIGDSLRSSYHQGDDGDVLSMTRLTVPIGGTQSVFLPIDGQRRDWHALCSVEL